MAGRKKTETNRTTMLISITEGDKLFLKRYALDNHTTASALVHDYIQGLRKKSEKASKKQEKQSLGTADQESFRRQVLFMRFRNLLCPNISGKKRAHGKAP